jgi:hypothetical protein
MLFRRFARRIDLEELRARCIAADRLVDRRAAALAQATARHLAQPDSNQAVEQLDAAEELHYLAEYNQRRARRALKRAEARDASVPYLLARLTAARRPSRRNRE